MNKVALLGLGTMGIGMAQNLLKQGLSLTVYNRTIEKTQALRASGAQVAITPAEAVQAAEIVISMVSNDEASQTIWTGDNGALAAVKPGTILIETSTLSLNWITTLAEKAAQWGCAFLDVPVAGSRDAAAAGTLRLFVGGDAAVLEQVRPVLAAFSSAIYHMGDVGAGTATKLVFNTLLAAQIATLVEALKLGEHLGIDANQLATLITESSLGNFLIKAKINSIVAGQFEPAHFKLRWMLKDVNYALQAGENVPMPLITAVQAAYQDALQSGLGDYDFAAVGSHS